MLLWPIKFEEEKEIMIIKKNILIALVLVLFVSDFSSFSQSNKHTQDGSVNTTKRFAFTIKPGVDYNLFTFKEKSTSDPSVYDCNNYLSDRVGFSVEYILSSKNTRWFLEPAFRYCSGKTSLSDMGYALQTQSFVLELPFGIRRYFVLNYRSKIFVNAAFVYNVMIYSDNEFVEDDYSSYGGYGNYGYGYSSYYISQADRELPGFKSGHNYMGGVGYQLKDRFSVELKYYTKREMLKDNSDWNADYENFSLVFGYTF